MYILDSHSTPNITKLLSLKWTENMSTLLNALKLNPFQLKFSWFNKYAWHVGFKPCWRSPMALYICYLSSVASMLPYKSCWLDLSIRWKCFFYFSTVASNDRFVASQDSSAYIASTIQSFNYYIYIYNIQHINIDVNIHRYCNRTDAASEAKVNLTQLIACIYSLVNTISNARIIIEKWRW